MIYKPSAGNYIDSVNASLETARDSKHHYILTKTQSIGRDMNFHIKCSNDSFIQAVSVFAIGYANHFLSESGGEQSITNSNSTLGRHYIKRIQKRSICCDTGYVTHIVPPKDLQKESINVIWRSLNVGLSHQMLV